MTGSWATASQNAAPVVMPTDSAHGPKVLPPSTEKKLLPTPEAPILVNEGIVCAGCALHCYMGAWSVNSISWFVNEGIVI